MARDEPLTALIGHCKRLTSIKYRIDDFIDALSNRGFMVGDEQFTSLAIDWLGELARDPSVRDDAWLNARAPEVGQLQRERYTSCTLSPTGFAECIFPFFQLHGWGPGELVPDQVNPFLVIGGTRYRHWPRTLSGNALSQINLTAEGSTPGSDTAYARLGALPLYVAYEGKNRVRAFREAGRDICAFTHSNHFPDAQTLRLHEVAGSLSFAVSDTVSDSLHTLMLPSVTAPLLKSYGVPKGKRISRGMSSRLSLKRAHWKLQTALISHVIA